MITGTAQYVIPCFGQTRQKPRPNHHPFVRKTILYFIDLSLKGYSPSLDKTTQEHMCSFNEARSELAWVIKWMAVIDTSVVVAFSSLWTADEHATPLILKDLRLHY